MPDRSRISQAHFLTSASKLCEAPQTQSIEIACVGRSNVGKSSFVNYFLNKKGLAKSSSTPGKTRLINFFEALYEGRTSQREDEGGVRGDGWDEKGRMEGAERIAFRIIDLPGFGYAKVSKEQKREWERNLVEFLTHRSGIKLFVHLIDSRHPDLPQDRMMREFLLKHIRGDQRVMEIYTKADKLTSAQRNRLKGLSLISVIAGGMGRVLSLAQLQTKVMESALGREYHEDLEIMKTKG